MHFFCGLFRDIFKVSDNKTSKFYLMFSTDLRNKKRNKFCSPLMLLMSNFGV